VLTQLREPHRFPQLTALREEMTRWRFYHQFRTDPDAPMRHPQVGIYTPVLANDGHDLAAALASISDSGLLHDGIEKGLDGASLEIDSDANQRFMVCLAVPGIGRAFDARELSDGTLRYLCLLAALLSKRPPPLLALNEPETSLHPDLHEPLARLIAEASRTSQLWITTHSRELAASIEKYSGVAPVELKKANGATLLKDGVFGGTMGF
jgi:predicted ATPase